MRRAPVLAALAATFAFAASASAQDVSGTWEIRPETPRGAQTVNFTFAQDGSALTGSAEMTRGRPGGGGGGGGGGGQSRTVEITDGTVVDGNISFSLILGAGQRSFTMTFVGTVDGDAMKGTVSNPRGGENPFTGKRK
jgi:hypothetical protein